jgi:hypothetical protein
VKTTPTAAMDVLLNLTPLDLLIMVEVRLALYRLHTPKQPTNYKTKAGMLSIGKKVGDPILNMRSDHTTLIYYFSRTFNVIIDQDYWKTKDPKFPEHVVIWYTDSSRTGSGIHGLRPKRSLSFSLGKFATVFQTETYVIFQCACENIRRAYRNTVKPVKLTTFVR